LPADLLEADDLPRRELAEVSSSSSLCRPVPLSASARELSISAQNAARFIAGGAPAGSLGTPAAGAATLPAGSVALSAVPSEPRVPRRYVLDRLYFTEARCQRAHRVQWTPGPESTRRTAASRTAETPFEAL